MRVAQDDGERRRGHPRLGDDAAKGWGGGIGRSAAGFHGVARRADTLRKRVTSLRIAGLLPKRGRSADNAGAERHEKTCTQFRLLKISWTESVANRNPADIEEDQKAQSAGIRICALC